MPKYKCKDCGAIWYGWGEGKICLKCGGKLEPFLKIPLIKNRLKKFKVNLEKI